MHFFVWIFWFSDVPLPFPAYWILPLLIYFVSQIKEFLPLMFALHVLKPVILYIFMFPKAKLYLCFISSWQNSRFFLPFIFFFPFYSLNSSVVHFYKKKKEKENRSSVVYLNIKYVFNTQEAACIISKKSHPLSLP